jgi:hypothetical protein
MQVDRISLEILTSLDKGLHRSGEVSAKKENTVGSTAAVQEWTEARLDYHYEHWAAFKIAYTQFCIQLTIQNLNFPDSESEVEEEGE